MAESAARAQRAAALEEKRRKLEDLKKRREKRGEDTKAVKEKASANLDEYIDGLLSEPTAEKPKQQQPETTIKPAVSRDEETNGEISHPSNVIAEPAPAPPPQRTVDTFAVGTQTDDLEEFEEQDDEEKPGTAPKATPSVPLTETEAKSTDELKVLKDDELERKISNEHFSVFINTASKKVERLLGTTPILSQILVDFVGETDTKQVTTSDASKFVNSQTVYECPKWTAGRDITDVDWSPQHRELVLSSYHMRDPAKIPDTAVSQKSPDVTLSSSLTPRSGELQSDGLVLVWSLSMPRRPENIFTCGSPVTCARFHPTESTLIIGGCESGQLVVWDVRSGRLPVQKSSLTTVAGSSSKGHTHPVNTMNVIEGGAGLVTTSTDGRVNFWSLSNLREPAESLQVGDSISSVAIAPESETLLLGDESGNLYTIEMGGQRRRQAKKLNTSDADGETLGHYGVITSLSTKILKKSSTARAAGLVKGFLRGSGGLVLSTGVDWTVKLWGPAYSEQPLISIVSHSYDYMSDVMWSPMHPSVFATASSNGTIGLWNLATSFEEPITGQEGIVVEPDAMMSGTGLNRLRWSSDGRRIAVASSDRVHVLTLSEEAIKNKGDEDSKIMNHLLSRHLIERQ